MLHVNGISCGINPLVGIRECIVYFLILIHCQYRCVSSSINSLVGSISGKYNSWCYFTVIIDVRCGCYISLERAFTTLSYGINPLCLEVCRETI